MKALKALVAFLGLLLVIGFAALGYGLYTGAHLKGTAASSSSSPSSSAAVPSAVAEFGTVQIPLPAGSRIDQMSTVGDRVVLRLSGGGPERLLVIDPAGGKVAGAFVLAPEPSVR
ncbi:hypothetical protein [Magnetospirillum sp. SS-4]|uniref:hypothetical protein n=1 Tax=Magnetospirillum sp. SS-4 TaxID=2681465 RepID=UPI00137C5B59|nr:hypothetical protein [Magnetospirillum sp. SS-4]CAA7622317.1 conserved exported hypothetical protein [Magnetospirillum sp. SS-4]